MLALGVFSAAAAAPLDDGIAAYHRDDFVTAMRTLKPLAEAGDPLAQYHLGRMYRNGKGVTENDAKAVSWYLKAARQGLGFAQTDLGAAYYTGEGVVQDDASAFYWTQLAANQGVSLAQSNLSILYAEGYGVPQDYNQSVLWARKAAEQGEANGQNILCVAYRKGQGAPQDYVQAVSWCRKAAEQGNAVGQFELGLLYRSGQGVPQDYIRSYMWLNLAAAQNTEQRETYARERDALLAKMSAAQLKRAQRLSSEWKVGDPDEVKAYDQLATLPWLWIGIAGAGALFASLALWFGLRGRQRLPDTARGQRKGYKVEARPTDAAVASTPSARPMSATPQPGAPGSKHPMTTSYRIVFLIIVLHTLVSVALSSGTPSAGVAGALWILTLWWMWRRNYGALKSLYKFLLIVRVPLLSIFLIWYINDSSNVIFSAVRQSAAIIIAAASYSLSIDFALYFYFRRLLIANADQKDRVDGVVSLDPDGVQTTQVDNKAPSLGTVRAPAGPATQGGAAPAAEDDQPPFRWDDLR